MYHLGRWKPSVHLSVGKWVTNSSWLTTFSMNHYNHGRSNSHFDAWCLWLQDTWYRIQPEHDLKNNLNLALCLGSFAISKKRIWQVVLQSKVGFPAGTKHRTFRSDSAIKVWILEWIWHRHRYVYIYMLYYTLSYYVISYYILLYYITILYCIIILYYYSISFHIMSYYIMLSHIVSYYIISYNIISYNIVLYNMISYHIISYYIILYYMIWYI